jgi:hypothetical protein
MYEGEKSDPASVEWRDKVCSNCFTCRTLLRFMEGPICDSCLDQDDLRVIHDKYYGMKVLQKIRDKADRDYLLGACEDDEDCVPLPTKSGVRLVVRDSLAVDLCCLGRIVYHRVTKSTMDTLPVGWKTKSR